jgi:cell wall-associated NlpC family hydrolase
MRRRAVALLPLVAIAVAGCGQDHPAGGKKASSGGDEVVLTPQAAAAAREHLKTERVPKTHAKVVQLQGAGAQPTYAPGGAADSGPSPGAASDAEIRSELKEARAELKAFNAHLSTADLQTGPRAKVLPDGSAVAPRDAPRAVKRVILAGNEIAKFPYKWGGGHGAWRDNGYDCSGSVSFALAGAGFLDRPLTSGLFESWGDAGPGRWITIYASAGHVWMIVAGLRFDTSGQGRAGTRWQPPQRPTGGFTVRHVPGY